MSKIYAFICILLIEIVACAGADSNAVKYRFYAPVNSPVNFDTSIPIPVMSIKPDQKDCDPSKTVCVSTERRGTIISFQGNFSAITSVRVTSDVDTWNIPMVHVKSNQYFAYPMLGIFRHPTLSFSKALKFLMPIRNGDVEAAEDLVQGEASRDCIWGKLCYLVTGKKIMLWGTIGSFKSVLVNGDNGKTVIIPIMLLYHPYTLDVNPPVLAVPESGIFNKPYNLEFKPIFKSVKVIPSTIKEMSSCTLSGPCYESIEAPYFASFTGVMPARPLNIKFKGQRDQQRVTYHFGSGGTKKCCRVTY